MCNSKKKCRVCLEEKDLCEFSNDKRLKDGKFNTCKSCELDRVRKINNTDPKKYRVSKERKELLEKGLKKCKKCGEEKDLCEFSNHKGMKDGKFNTCKSCQLDLERKRNNTDPKNYLITKKEKQELDKQKLQRCSCCMEIKSFDYFTNNKRIFNGKSNECRSCRNIRQNKRYKNDPLFRLYNNIRTLIGQSLKERTYSKKTRTYQILGCSTDEFKTYLENQFEPWMNWDNQGLYNGTENYGWDLDHIIPISSVTTEEELIRLNHYTNLQPLCSYINRVVKRDRLDY